MADIKHSSLILWSGAICCFSALYVDFPSLIGCSGKNEFLCIEEEFCLKLNTPAYPLAFTTGGSHICQCSLCIVQFGLKMPTVLCKNKNQVFCCVQQASLPPDGDVPLMCAICFIALYPAIGICKKVSEEDKVKVMPR